jgi:hypothetical protein
MIPNTDRLTVGFTRSFLPLKPIRDSFFHYKASTPHAPKFPWQNVQMGRRRLPRYQRLIWEHVENDTKQTVQKEFTPTKKTWGLLRGIWKAKVYYLNDQFNYGREICDRAIAESRRIDPSQAINDSIIRVVLKLNANFSYT